jgi:DnaJ-class molecular chaperone
MIIPSEMTRPPCKECNGTGEVVYTKERGGPTCNSCGGAGHLTDIIIQRIMASIMDYPSVYMGGPSPGNMKRAEKIIEFLKKEGLLS